MSPPRPGAKAMTAFQPGSPAYEQMIAERVELRADNERLTVRVKDQNADYKKLQDDNASCLRINTELRVDNERLRSERDQWNADARRLSGGLMAIRGADETVPASVLRSVAYDIALNCIEPDVATYQITRRALEHKP